MTNIGHAEVDQHHAILDSLIYALDNHCVESDAHRYQPCDGCETRSLKSCRETLVRLLGELVDVLRGHMAYEEKMMELLPRSPAITEHITEHKASHQRIQTELSGLLARAATGNPAEVAATAHQQATLWLGVHTDQYDRHLVSNLGDSGHNEIDFDEALIGMLDEYVFPNRPSLKTASPLTQFWLEKRKMQAFGYLDRLSPAQKRVLWKIVAGLKNRDIAEALGCSINTVKSHRSAIFQKLEVSSALELINKLGLFR